MNTDHNNELIRLLDMPAFKDVASLSGAINIDTGRLNILINKPHKFYRRYHIKKSNGKLREIHQPNKEMKAIQAWILRNILDKLSPSPHATAFVSGLGLASNVDPHSSNRYFLCVDIEDFFPSIPTYKVRRIFQLIGYSQNASSILARLCTCKNGLPQGGITSPGLSNLVCGHLDRRMSGLVAKRNMVYTRYADDMTFSANNPALFNKSLSLIQTIIKDEGFELNDGKTRFLGPKNKCVVTGLVKNSACPGFGIGKKKKTKMRAIMHNFVTGQEIDQQYKSKESLVGWLAYLKSVDRQSYESMNNYWIKLNNKYGA